MGHNKRLLAIIISTLSLGLFIACSSDDSEIDAISKQDLAVSLAKGDNTPGARLCQSLGLPANCDYCQVMGWYTDGVCDTFCPNADPQCTIATDATLIVRSQSMRGFYIYVDDVLLGQDGMNGDYMDGYFSGKVRGNQEHTIRVYDGKNTFNSRYYFAAGETKTVNVESEDPNDQVTVIIKTQGIFYYSVYVDGAFIGQEGTGGDITDGTFTFKVKGNMIHKIRVSAPGYDDWSQAFKFDKVGIVTLHVTPVR